MAGPQRLVPAAGPNHNPAGSRGGAFPPQFARQPLPQGIPSVAASVGAYHGVDGWQQAPPHLADPGVVWRGGASATAAAATGATSQICTMAPAPRDEEATQEHCIFCFDVLLARLRGERAPPLPPSVNPDFQAPMFVTWTKFPSPGCEGELRGCIGCLDNVAMEPGLRDYALKSSLEDKRFSPIRLEEFPTLSCKVSILHSFETAAHCHDWVIGVHGIIIKFKDESGKSYSSTYLPDVPLEHGMTRESAITGLVKKSGFRGPCSEALLRRISTQRYQSSLADVDYNELQQRRAAVSGGPRTNGYSSGQQPHSLPQEQQGGWSGGWWCGSP